MIERIVISQYGKIDNTVKPEPKEAPKVKPRDLQSSAPADQIVISDAGKRAQEAARYVKVAKELPEVDLEKVAQIQIKMESPVYLKKLAENVAESIADRIIEGIDARYTG